ncbi:MAG: tyrosine-type recombinase/integrase [Alphaproteobacteria bacterium]|nr:tyrosine-type recombinase/integrase [Alphaproteobacteria bacterium]MBU0865109.1 tyrosine-type recombinase/integrase [Alphaproteobacteria bacterium]MBU1824886.1 tyrosine-type recombinase/integrase [Alphaproteobacteria bacterium]
MSFRNRRVRGRPPPLSSRGRRGPEAASCCTNPYVIAGRVDGQHLTDLQPFWQRVRGRAGLKDARIHDIRHTFASVAVSNGMSLPIIGKLLGHTQVQTTARYAHLARASQIEAANDITGLIEDSLAGRT